PVFNTEKIAFWIFFHKTPLKILEIQQVFQENFMLFKKIYKKLIFSSYRKSTEQNCLEVFLGSPTALNAMVYKRGYNVF
ncbi:MAG: hypothetical protein FWC41_03175, partial [Firmicutes bacterium]|nr:hypothetical protein [Bacillota bacterium]